MAKRKETSNTDSQILNKEKKTTTRKRTAKKAESTEPEITQQPVKKKRANSKTAAEKEPAKISEHVLSADPLTAYEEKRAEKPARTTVVNQPMPDAPTKLKKDKAVTTQPVTKVCKKCGKEKPLKDFNYWNKEKQTYMDICKECEKIKNKEKHEKRRDLITELKKCGCVCCGEKETCCLDFHHIDQEHKEFNMGSALNKSEERILEEAAKCVVVCSNCHRKIHSGLIDIFDYINVSHYQYIKRLISIKTNI